MADVTSTSGTPKPPEQRGVLSPTVTSPTASSITSPAAACLEEEVKAEEQQKKKILLIEDNDFQAAVVSGLLKSLGYEVTVAESGVIALEKKDLLTFNAVICDFNMPGKNGDETIAAIRALEKQEKSQNPNYKPLKIIGYSDQSTQEERDRVGGLFTDAGADIFLPKPVNPPTFENNLNELLQEKEPERPGTPVDKTESTQALPRNRVKTTT